MSSSWFEKAKKNLFILRSQPCTMFGLKSRVPSSSIVCVRGKGKFRSGVGKYQKIVIFLLYNLLYNLFWLFLSIKPPPKKCWFYSYTQFGALFFHILACCELVRETADYVPPNITEKKRNNSGSRNLSITCLVEKCIESFDVYLESIWLEV